MVVDELTTIWQAGSHIALRYRETHMLAGVRHARYSTAILEVAAGGVLWHAPPRQLLLDLESQPITKMGAAVRNGSLRPGGSR